MVSLYLHLLCFLTLGYVAGARGISRPRPTPAKTEETTKADLRAANLRRNLAGLKFKVKGLGFRAKGLGGVMSYVRKGLTGVTKNMYSEPYIAIISAGMPCTLL